MDDLGINIKDAEKVLKVFSDAVPDNNGSGYSKKAITAFCGHVTTILKAAASFSSLEESSPSKILDHVLQTLLAHPNTMQQAERTKPQERLALPTIVKIMEGCDEQIQKWAATGRRGSSQHLKSPYPDQHGAPRAGCVRPRFG